MPNFTASSQYNIYFEVRQRSRERVYEYRLHPGMYFFSPNRVISVNFSCKIANFFSYTARKGDRNVCLNINPPLLLTEDTKFEFFTKAKYESHIFNANSRLQKWANNNNKGKKNVTLQCKVYILLKIATWIQVSLLDNAPNFLDGCVFLRDDSAISNQQ